MSISKQDTNFATKSLDFEKKMIIQKISQMSNLPTPGAGIMKVMLLLRDEDVAMRELIEAISHNQSLVARILKLINSGYYGLRKTIDTVDRAVNLLGILKVKQVVYSASIMDIFTKDEEQEWNHAYSSSVLMSSIMEEHEIPAASNLPLTVLMHDIGKVILRRFAPKKYIMALKMSADEKVPISIAEEAVIHINHAQAGGWLLEKWQMSDDIFKPVANHHLQGVPEEYVLETALLQFVNWVDCTARNVPCAPPTKELMFEAGFEEIDNDYWIDYQRNMVNEIEGQAKKEEENQPEAETTSGQEKSAVPIPPPPKTSLNVSTKKFNPEEAARVVRPTLEKPELETKPAPPEQQYTKTSTEKIEKIKSGPKLEAGNLSPRLPKRIIKRNFIEDIIDIIRALMKKIFK
ncbi:MAG: hypothetical protein A2017_04170 [Lentisphaerae bacterium GWF2_44_16]|nr:MAG: hypothetical protein A2017_04170 [Lentisphaerae bacterium GWF2_44_16]